MKQRIKTILFLLLFLISLTSSVTALEIKSESITKIPDDISANIIGMRVYKELAYIMNANGKYIIINLTDGDISSFKIDSANKILDFDVVLGKIIYLDDQGMLGGHAFPKWSKGPYKDVCQIEACDQGLILSGGNNSYFLSKNATTSIELPEINFALPVNNGFIWSMSLDKEKHWQANLYDCFGNLMGNVYKFSEYFEPTNIEIGPNGIEGEMLISATEGAVRTLALIGNNGRMFWKINGPQKVCARDVGFDQMDDLIVLDRNTDGDIVISRWKFTIPEG